MLDPLDIPQPFIASELDFHRARITEDFAAAELRRRNRVERRLRRQEQAKSPGRHRTAVRTA
jgi:hypothetical protein